MNAETKKYIEELHARRQRAAAAPSTPPVPGGPGGQVLAVRPAAPPAPSMAAPATAITAPVEPELSALESDVARQLGLDEQDMKKFATHRRTAPGRKK